MSTKSRHQQRTARLQAIENAAETENAARAALTVAFTVTATRNLALLAESAAIYLTDFASTLMSADITGHECTHELFSCNAQGTDTFFGRFFTDRDRLYDAAEALKQAQSLRAYAADLRKLADVAQYGPGARELAA